MMEHQHQQGGGGETAPSAKGKEAAVCEECRQKPSQYRCPGCSIRTCSLPCVKSHKQRTRCSGKRNHTQLLPDSGYNDSVLLSDYNMLEEGKRVAESSQRKRANLCPHSSYHLPDCLRGLQMKAASRRTQLLFFPSGMSRRNRNKSRYNHKKKQISWTIGWHFHSVDVILYDHQIREDANLRSVIEKHLQPGPWKHKLKQFCDVQLDDHLKFFIREHYKGPRSPFRELDIDAPIREQLANLVILEYPVIHVVLPTQSCYFEISEDAHPISRKRNVKDANGNEVSPMRGVFFKEEQIEEDGHVEPQIDDSSKHPSGSTMNRMCHKKMGSNRPLLGRYLSGNACVYPVINESGTHEDIELDFDAYSDLIAQMNPDDFLDLDGEYAGKGEVSLVGDEVEEGGDFAVTGD